MNRIAVATTLVFMALAQAAWCGPDAGAIDKVSIRSQMMATRVPLAAARVAYSVQPIVGPGRPQDWLVAWSNSGFRVETVTEGAVMEDHFTRLFDAGSGQGISYDGLTHATVAVGAGLLGFGDLFSDYWCFVGCFPNRGLTGGEPMLNDPVHLLSLSETSVLALTETIDDVECVVVEYTPQGGPSPLLRGWYAPELGFAQAMLRTYSPSGKLRSEWVTESWLPATSGSVSLPLVGRFTSWSTAGDVEVERLISVALDDQGQPNLVLGTEVELELDLPAGTTIMDLNSGLSSVVQNDVDASAAMAIAAGERAGANAPTRLGSPLQSLLVPALAAVGALAVGLLVPTIRRRPSK